MDAIELADKLMEYMEEAATMLRQQHAEIETLKFHGYRTQYELLRIEFIQQHAEIETLKLKELTDEEISDIRDEFLSPSGCDIYTFAKAILRKAQEK